MWGEGKRGVVFFFITTEITELHFTSLANMILLRSFQQIKVYGYAVMFFSAIYRTLFLLHFEQRPFQMGSALKRNDFPVRLIAIKKMAVNLTGKLFYIRSKT